VSIKDLSSSISDLVTAAAVVIGGGWAYMKYVRGRTFRNRARLDMAADIRESDHARALLVTVAMHNDGASRIELGLENEKFVRVDAVFDDEWTPDANIDWDTDGPVIMTRLFREHAWLEPDETITDELLMPLPSPDDTQALAYRVRARVFAPRQLGGRVGSLAARALGRKQGEVTGWVRRTGQTWTQNRIVPVALSVGDVDQRASVIDGGEEVTNRNAEGRQSRGSRELRASPDIGGRRNA
jgi:hypothetical protein